MNAAAQDEARLPMPVDEIATWAETAVPAISMIANSGLFSGWLSQNTAAQFRGDMQSLEPGTYRGQIACLGDGEITFDVHELADLTENAPVVCTENVGVVFEATIIGTGATFTMYLDGAPTVYAVSLSRVG